MDKEVNKRPEVKEERIKRRIRMRGSDVIYFTIITDFYYFILKHIFS